MFQTRLWAAACILALVLVVGFVLSVPRARDLSEPGRVSSASTTPPVAIHDVYKKGVHTITGSLTAPNACAQISTNATLASSTVPQIVIDLTGPVAGGLCLQVPTKIPFTATLRAPSGTPIEVRINGALASTTRS